LSASEAKALASGNPDVMKAVQLKNDIRRLQMVRASHNDQQLRIKQSIDNLPLVISAGESRIAALNQDSIFIEKQPDWEVTIGKNKFSEKDRDAANTALLNMVKQIPLANTSVVIGKVNGFTVQASQQHDGFRLILKGTSGVDHVTSTIGRGDIEGENTGVDLIQRALNQIKNIPTKMITMEREVQKNRDDLASFTSQANKPFERNEQLERWQQELIALEKKLQNIEEEPVQSTETVGAFG